MLVTSLVVAFAMQQPPQRPADLCPPTSTHPGQPYFEFQVEQMAIYIGKDTTSVRPDASLHARLPYPPDFALAQFVVDTLGVPIPGTLKMLSLPAGFPAKTLTFAITEWRFRPARVGGCVVPQLVQTPLKWR